MSKTISPLAPKSYPALPAIEGVRIATAEAGIRYKNRTDVLYVSLARDTAVAGVFTRSKCPSAPVDWCRKNLGKNGARALVVNSGNANAFTGKKGIEAVKLTADFAAKAAGCRASQVFIASTGVIGEPLDAARFKGVLESCEKKAKPLAWVDAAKAIMTTDTFPKVATRTANIGGIPVTINGVAKGAGMIAPDMATMLSFIFTDAPIAAPVLQALLKKGADKSFNCVTIDSDTSTSDTLLFFATGAAAKRGAPAITLPSDRRLKEFRQELEGLLSDLAQQVARDGEGARKFVTVKITGAKGAISAKRIAMAVANSPLVKTAVAGEDANWGRVVMAVGKAGEPADRDKLAIWFGDIRVAAKGARDPAYDEAKTTAYMRGSDIIIRVDLGLGRGEATVWTCDLTKEYVEINGDYRS
ncbi:bifunctional glutamate N-acetyltransferase/amino-acid acetyltransferase ArgJ [Microvirga brassicacearum]|uniref:Arginine biosynthesis bifunctional protein ArgJ n=1 Tax=Microvirga brassicacearum TaxID=2580413 RepID=A0A5N3PC16_9HYPH|nr:bifunctional glutamate N-acetyltransferase/amino-acid acetyltransferase ArgJ [Microvirga brassicacearum]KAB0267287.1 bifunctional glutamate N-acetyltransferase/amino-acid acetyltransferase ArgJ [Microvirga brassicacearum]